MNTPRYVLRDARVSQSATLTGKIREPWQILDTQSNQIIDEYNSKRAAQMTITQLNRESA